MVPLIHQVDQGQHQVPDKAIPTDSVRSDAGISVGDETGRLENGNRGLGPRWPSRVQEPADHFADVGQGLELDGARAPLGQCHVVSLEVIDRIRGLEEVVMVACILDNPREPVTARPVPSIGDPKQLID